MLISLVLVNDCRSALSPENKSGSVSGSSLGTCKLLHSSSETEHDTMKIANNTQKK